MRNFLTHLAVKRAVSASTQALAASLFLYKQVPRIDLVYGDIRARSFADREGRTDIS